jgi:cyclopropane fatty-acyl-phospholipid synthase-like methyltransferase
VTKHTDDVRRYYDVNTSAFQQLGQGGNDGVIRRAVWGPGVSSRAAAFQYVDRLIASELRELQQRFASPLRVLDFGCGLGTSLLTLSAELPIEGVGVTISAFQARIAQERFAAAQSGEGLQCIQADFLALPDSVAPAHLLFAIEAFVHSPSPALFFEAAARHVQPQGSVVICDDFLTTLGAQPRNARERRQIADFRHGWVAPSTVTTAVANAAAEQAGFEPVNNLDLTQYLELRRPRDRALSLVASLIGRLPIPGYRWRSLMGGNALQLALMSGLIEHRYLSWRRV